MTYSGPWGRRGRAVPEQPPRRLSRPSSLTHALTLPRASAALGALGLIGVALGWTYEGRAAHPVP